MTTSQRETLENRVRYYPSEALKKKLNNYALQTGEYKSELAVRLMKEFFDARRKENHDANTVAA